jgi:hypothetical protein
LAGKAYVWTDDRCAWLMEQVEKQVQATGRNDFTKLGKAVGTTATGAKLRYQALARDGKCPTVAELIRRHRQGEDKAATIPEQEVQTTTTEQGIEARSNGSRIRTVEDLLKHIEADMTRYEIDRCEATKYEMGSKDADGKAVVTELHRVFVKLKPKAGPSTLDLVEGIVRSAFVTRKPLVVRRPALVKGDLLQLVVIPEPHVGKFAWDAETRWGNYDIPIAVEMLRDLMGQAVEKGDARKPARRLIACIGDYFHYDTPHGSTTKGTPLDRDGRVQKMITEGSRALFDMIEMSAAEVPTEVLLTPGNHDEVLTWALQTTLLSHFRHDKRVTINDEVTTRKYRRWGKTLLGFTHGNNPPLRQLPALMASERPEDWGATIYREFHTGDKHAVASIQTIDRVITRTCPSISAADKWHSDNGYVGQLRAMETFFYSQHGHLAGMDVMNPTVKRSKAA